ncbi:hypothetical protein [Streptomyces sp. CNQ085]|nr:hypothetical protein [Streptomyces sp. CNQ085]MCI0383712.1 hypothetical protein [Streptomyces sp. CNQ085]
MTRRYVHATTPLTQEAVRRMGDALWPQTETRTETSPTKAARARRRIR